MQWEDPRLAFPSAEQYAFLFENAHLLLLSWKRDNAKFLFLICEQRPDGLLLDYPGETFTHRVMDILEQIFFIQLEQEGEEPQRYVLGSYFRVGDRAYGAYYPRAASSKTDVVLFRIDGEIPNVSLSLVEGAEYEGVAQAFQEQHEDLIDIQNNL